MAIKQHFRGIVLPSPIDVRHLVANNKPCEQGKARFEEIYGAEGPELVLRTLGDLQDLYESYPHRIDLNWLLDEAFGHQGLLCVAIQNLLDGRPLLSWRRTKDVSDHFPNLMVPYVDNALRNPRIHDYVDHIRQRLGCEPAEDFAWAKVLFDETLIELGYKA